MPPTRRNRRILYLQSTFSILFPMLRVYLAVLKRGIVFLLKYRFSKKSTSAPRLVAGSSKYSTPFARVTARPSYASRLSTIVSSLNPVADDVLAHTREHILCLYLGQVMMGVPDKITLRIALVDNITQYDGRHGERGLYVHYTQ